MPHRSLAPFWSTGLWTEIHLSAWKYGKWGAGSSLYHWETRSSLAAKPFCFSSFNRCRKPTCWSRTPKRWLSQKTSALYHRDFSPIQTVEDITWEGFCVLQLSLHPLQSHSADGTDMNVSQPFQDWLLQDLVLIQSQNISCLTCTTRQKTDLGGHWDSYNKAIAQQMDPYK